MDNNMADTKAPLLASDESGSDFDAEHPVIHPGVNLKNLKQRTHKIRIKPPKSKKVICAIITFILSALTISIGLYLGIATRAGMKVSWLDGLQHGWSNVYDNYRSEAALRLVDVDRDGKLDIIFALSRETVEVYVQNRHKMREICQQLGETWPCGGLIVAVRGFDGKELWRIRAHHEVFAINCDTIDINGDGINDCLCSGRFATFLAIDPVAGHVLWRWNSEYLVEEWGVFFPLAVPDWDGDGVPELLIGHGGDPRLEDWDFNRPAARFLLISGLTGRSIGPYMNTTDGKEMYMAPLLHQAADGNHYVIYGTGGETISGALYAIPLNNIESFFMLRNNKITMETVFAPYTWATSKHRGDNGEIEIYRSYHTGIPVTPLLVDVNKDHVKDILLLNFDATVVLINGETLEYIWERSFPGCQTYSSPVPGYFNDDDVIDFMIQVVFGVWIDYNSTKYYILDGASGKDLWSYEIFRDGYDVTTPLMLRLSQEGQHRDSFLIRTAGRPTEDSAEVWVRGVELSGQGPEHDDHHTEGHTHTHKRIRRHGVTNTTKKRNLLFWCNEDSATSVPRAEAFLFDRTIANHPIKVADSGVLKYYYNITKAYQRKSLEARLLETVHGIPVKDSEDSDIGCVAAGLRAIGTGVVGDIDGDGQLDVITNFHYVARLQDWHHKKIRSVPFVRIVKTSLQDIFAHNETPMKNIHVKKSILKAAESEIKLNENMYSASTNQPFAQYHGRHSASTYSEDEDAN